METKRKSWQLSLPALRGVTLIAPPIAFALLWLTPKVRWREKILGTLGIPLFGILHGAALLWCLHHFFDLTLYEWRGGYYPTLTLHQTRPDYSALEEHRKRTRSTPAEPNATPSDDCWPGFRGPNRDGICSDTRLLKTFGNGGVRLLWRQPIGGGYGSFAIANGVAFTIEQRRSQGVVTAYDLATGRELWAHGWEAEFRETIGGDGPRATPIWHDGRIYAQGACGELRSLDAIAGKLIWRHNVLQENGAPSLEYGCSASPLVFDDLVVTVPGGSNGASVAAYDQLTGARRWAVGNDRQSYVSPMLVTLAGERQILVVAAQRTMGLSAADGTMLWEFRWGEPLMGRNVAQPVLWDGDKFLLSAGYGVGCVAVQVVRGKHELKARELWRNGFLKNKFSSSIFWQGNLYGLDEDILTCLDASTGGRRWKDGRYGYGQLLLASDCLVILCGNGDLALVRARPDRHEEMFRVPAIHGKTWNYPAICSGKLLIRNLAEMACFDLSTP
jgi:outer membrane protein assembly factor BamB